MMIEIQQITPAALVEKMTKEGDNLLLVDVRENFERDICQLANSLFIPMPLIPLHMDKLPHEKEIVIYCHHGIRSYHVARYLVDAGFDEENIYNLVGGIDAWAKQIDPTMAQY